MNTEKNMEFDLPADDEKQETNQELENELSDIKQQLNDCKGDLVRTRAEMENQRKRMEREMNNTAKFALQDFINRLLPAKDSMEKGLDVAYMEDGIDVEVLFEGMTSTLRICNDAFKSAGIEEIDPIGKDFDPEIHEAMAIKQVDGEKPNKVLSVYQKGYLLNGRLIRPARVEVSGV